MDTFTRDRLKVKKIRINVISIKIIIFIPIVASIPIITPLTTALMPSMVSVLEAPLQQNYIDYSRIC
jgi:hypothetical protein